MNLILTFPKAANLLIKLMRRGENGHPVKLDDYRTLAKKKLPHVLFDYIDGGACDEITITNNRNDFNNISLRPLCLRDVSELDLSINILGKSFSLPVCFSPTAFHQLLDRHGELSAANAAKNLNIPMIVSLMSSLALEDICRDSGNDNLWIQTYIFKDREITKSLIQRAEQSGYKALVITIGCPTIGKRDRNIRNRFSLPKYISAGNFSRKNAMNDFNNLIYTFSEAELDPSVTWKDVEWLRSITTLPLILKGIMNPIDIMPALDLQISGIIVSNHGGRQLDTTVSTIKSLPKIAEAVSGRIPLLIDSGIRRGTDVFKAIALGADAISLGRPVLWALAVDGGKEVINAVNLLVEELRIAMQLSGCSSLYEIRKNSKKIIDNLD